ncbi:MAG TPA: helix-turn-helix transcriptional regulator [Gemmatimonadaceae bacterium]|nr:helix-turn-helix transcriptional regulator [Gemmatimonadaceae bacterium]
MSLLARRLRELREARGLTQAELAEMAGLRRATVTEWENEDRQRPVIDVLVKLAKALGVEPGELLQSPAPAKRAGRLSR